MPLDQDLVPLRRWPVEADQQKVEVDGESVHRDHFRGICADERRQLIGDEFVVVLPAEPAGEMALNAQLGPAIELDTDRFSGCPG